MRTGRNAVNSTKQIARQMLEPLNATGTRIGNVEICHVVAIDVHGALNAQGYTLSEGEVRKIVLDAMVETRRFQIEGTPYQVYWFRGMQIVLAIVLVAMWFIALTLEDAQSNIRIYVYFAVTIASIGLPYAIVLMNKMIRSFRHKTIIGQ